MSALPLSTWRTPSTGWLLLGLSIAGAGCVHHPARTRFANEFNCPVADVTTDEIGGGGVRVTGCNQQVMYTCSGHVCVLNGAQTSRRSAAESRRIPAGVSRRTGDAGTILSVKTDVEGGALYFVAIPAKSASDVVMTLKAPLARVRSGNCPIDLVVNGERRELPAPTQRHVRGMDEVAVQVPVNLVAELVQAERVAARSCNVQFSLDAQDKALIAEFLTRLHEELAFDGKVVPAAAEDAPVDTQRL